MHTTRYFILPLALLAASCDPTGGEGPAEVCILEPSAATTDTAIGFRVDGRQVLQDSGGFYPQMYHYFSATDTFVQINAGVGETVEDYEGLSIRIVHFDGVGAYPIYAGWQATPFAFASYNCTQVLDDQWLGQEAVPDTVYVTAYDSATTAISGTFSFTATGYKRGGVIMISEGRFQGFIPKGGPAGTVEPAGASH